MGLTIFFVLLLLFIVYLLWMPIVLCINTNTNKYFIQFLGLAKASIEGDKKEILKLKLNVLFFNFYFYPLKLKSIKQKGTVKTKKNTKTNKIGNLKKGIRILKSFKVKKIVVEIDTGDCIMNAKLYPVFALLNYNFGNFRINFEGRNQMVLYMQNRPFNIIKSFINI
ncbi:hypothetical protein BX611_2787 [Lutibacter oceani]|uniref:Uncharacterized protein n=1 Tax=Lutibacter oceani TaxID=1853311 RepID=A0A3D9RK36_9FLAO|nr:hypothetical protein BX611_2787 [Lutibacter oceani]